ncbi:PQQ-binding-like beta-propeller repeat protein [Pseudomonas aeruginosa]
MSEGNRSRSRLLPSLLGLLILLSGLALLAGGIKLASLGGSLYYLLAGIGLALSGLLLLLGKRAALGLYALVLFASTVWALWEVGLDWWQLVPRLALWFVFGLLLWLPWFRRPLLADGPAPLGTAALGVAVVLAGAAAVGSQFTNPGQIVGRIDRDSGMTSTAPAMPDGDWQAYGRTEFGDRYSPLKQITPANVGQLEEAWRIRTGDLPTADDPLELTNENTPLKVNGMLYACTAHSKVLALDLNTGKLRWNYQFTHHDLWDMDVGSQPTLLDLKTADGVKPALIAPTKQGSLYVLDRRDGTPIVPIREVPAPQGAVEGDHTAPTQARSDLNLLRPPLTERDMWGSSPFDQMLCRIQFRSLRYEGQYTPPSEQGSLIYPGNVGVFNWGGVSVDPVRQILFTSPNYMAFVSQMVPRDKVPSGSKREGETSGVQPNTGAPYAVIMHPFMSPIGLPCQAPSWGDVAGIDLTTAKVVWQHKNGTSRDNTPVPIGLTVGVPSMGGSITTAGGVAFLSGTLDQYLRAYDVKDGKQLWQARLPAGGQATPMSYTGKDGRQYVLIVAGGHGSFGTRMGDYIIAYALPRQ